MESSLTALPVELWRIILLLACIPPQVLPFSVRKTSVAPVLLSHVCRSWRYLVINCPEFWTDIPYRFGRSSAYGKRPSSKLMKLFLERSLAMPLTLDIDIWDVGDPENRLEAYGFLLDLFTNRKRWTSATLFMSLEKIDENAWENIGALIEDAPLLETLKVIVQPGESKFKDIFENTLSALWNGAPKLTKLAIEIIGTNEVTEEHDFISWTLTNGIPYHRLTHLSLDPDAHGEMTWKEVASIFALAPKLVSCSLHGIHGNHSRSQPHPSTPPVVLQYLQHLDLAGPYNDSERPNLNDTLLRFMNQTLTAPSLQTLSLLEPADMWDKNEYADFIARSNPPLSSLHFGLSPDEGLLECIRLSPPTLQYLRTDLRSVFSPEFSEQMSEWDDKAGKFKLCPILQHLIFDLWTRAPFSKGMGDMLRKRLCPPDGSSGSFNTIDIPNYLRSKAEADLESLTNEPYCLRVECGKTMQAEARVW